jgi:hypothetical protein
MTEEEEKPDSGIPEWQRSQEDTEDNSTTTNEDITTTTNEDRIKVARRFLDDEKIKTSPRESKIAFLRGKGIDEADIKELLGEVEFSQPLASAVSILNAAKFHIQSYLLTNRAIPARPTSPLHPLLFIHLRNPYCQTVTAPPLSRTPSSSPRKPNLPRHS